MITIAGASRNNAVFCFWAAVRGKWDALEARLALEFDVISRDVVSMSSDEAFLELLHDMYMRKLPALYPENRGTYWTVHAEKAKLLRGRRFLVIRARYTGEGDSGAATERKKAELRKLAPVPNPTRFRKLNLNLHASDSPAEAAYLDDVLSPTSLRHAAIRKPLRTEMLDRLDGLRRYCNRTGVDVRDVCVVSGSVLEVCGLRQAGDLDVIALPEARSRLGQPEGFDLATPGYHPTISDEDIIDRLHFNVLGVKFAALPVVAEAKLSGRRVKDNKDVALLKANRDLIESLRC